MIQSFEELGLQPSILKAIAEMGFVQPMPVQAEVIPHLLQGTPDVIALAQTGTGKTAAFGLPLLQTVDITKKYPQALVLCPTRELCNQITTEMESFARYTDGVHIVAVYGGASIEGQIRSIKRGTQIVVATPGRLIDLMERRALNLSNVSTVVMDEADEMLNMGFLDSINRILEDVPESRSVLLFSATMPAEIADISKKYMKNPVEITIGNKNSGAENIRHIYHLMHAKDKYLALKRVADFYPEIYGIVFCRTRKDTQEVADKLMKDGYNAEALHGDLSQAQRDYVMQKFRNRNVRLLVATDVAARGLDVNDLTHVINFNLPDDIESYTHRSGRTGRAGKTGISIAFINLREKHLLKQIEKKIGKVFEHGHLPTGHQVCEKQLFHFIDKIEKTETHDPLLDKFLPSIMKKLEWIDKEELMRRFLTDEFTRLMKYYDNAPDIEVPEHEKPRFDRKGGDRDRDRDRGRGRKSDDDFGDRPRRGEKGNFRERSNDFEPRERYSRRDKQDSANYARLYINIGRADGVQPGAIIDLINRATPGKKITIGRIDLQKKHSVVEIESTGAQVVAKGLKKLKYRDIKLSAELEGKG